MPHLDKKTDDWFFYYDDGNLGFYIIVDKKLQNNVTKILRFTGTQGHMSIQYYNIGT